MPFEGPEAPSSQQPIEDVDAAREAAYAEKPARDYIAEYKEQLSPEARQSLEWIASQEAEKALKRYEETKNTEDPVVRVLRERALGSISMPVAVGAIAPRVGEVQGKEWLAGCEWAIHDLGAELVESTLADTYMDIGQKKGALERLGPGLASGIERFYRGRIIRGGEDAERFPAETLYGYFIGNLMAGKGLEALSPLQTRGRPRILIQMTGFLARARNSYPEIAAALDRDMSGRGLLWDKKQGKYIEMT